MTDSWQEKKLVEVCRKVSKTKPEDLSRPTFSYIDIGSVDSVGHHVAIPQLLPVGSAPSRARQLVAFGDTIFSTVRPYLLNIAWVGEELDGEIASTGFCVLRADTAQLLPKFLHLFCCSDLLLDQVLPLQRGVSYPAVRDSDVLSASVPLPPLAEQQRIVKILEEQFSRLDAALASIRTVREKAAAFRQSLLHAAFSGGIADRVEVHGDLPPRWTQFNLGDVVEFLSGYAFKSEWYVPDGVRLVRGQNISHGRLDWADARSISPTRASTFKRFDLNVGDLVLAMDRPLISTGLKWAVLREEDVPSLLLQRVVRLTVMETEMAPKFLQYWIQSPFFMTGINPGRSIGVPHISTKELGSLSLFLPSLGEQHNIVSILDEQFSLLDAALVVTSQLEARIASERRSLLHAAFSGTLTTQWRETNHG